MSALDNIFFYETNLEEAVEDPIFDSIIIPEVLKKAHKKRILEYKLGRLCAIRAAEDLDIDITNLTMNEDRSPSWPKTMVGSISHTKHFAISAVAKSEHYKSIGIDVEYIIRDQKMGSVESMVLTEKDKDYIESLEHPELNTIYTIIFSAKESLFKLIHPLVKNYFGFSDAFITEIDFEMSSFKIKLDSSDPKISKYNKEYSGFFEVKEGRVTTILSI